MKNKIFKKILPILISMFVVGYFTSNMVESTFATNVDKNPNVIVNINSDGSLTQEGDLFGGKLLFPSNVQDANGGIGSISGIIRIVNNYNKIDIDNLAIGLSPSNLDTRNDYPKDVVYNSFLDNVRLKIEKGSMFAFNKTLVNYTSLKDLLYRQDNSEFKGLILGKDERFSISKGQSVDLNYRLQMVEETGNELQSVTAYMPIYINLRGAYMEDNSGSNDVNSDIIVKKTEEKSKEKRLEKLNWAHDCIITLLNHKVIKGYLHEEIGIEDYFNGRVDPATYVSRVVEPEKNITRAEAAVLIGKALGLKEENKSDAEYIDPIPNWARGYIIATTKANIFKGYPSKEFRANNYITREEMIAVLTRAYGIKLEDQSIRLHFTDKDDISFWALENVKSGYEKTIIVGYPDGTYRPKNNITRGESFIIICKLMGLHDEHSITTTN